MVALLKDGEKTRLKKHTWNTRHFHLVSSLHIDGQLCRLNLQAYPQSILESTNYKRKRSIVKKLRPIGLHSDDTQQCLALLNILLHNNGKWDKSQWCSCLITALKTRAFRGYGRNFAQRQVNDVFVCAELTVCTVWAISAEAASQRRVAAPLQVINCTLDIL